MKLLDSDVLYVDNHIMVVRKKENLLTQKIASGEENLEDLCKEWLKEKFSKPGNVFLHCIHRLDKPVSGCVLFARTSKALSRLQEEMREKKIVRIYEAWVEGIFSQKEGTLEHYLVHGEHRAFVSSKEDTEAKKATLFFSVLEEKKNKTLVEIRLDTGRYHQIRAQFSAMGHPIIGDEKYGSTVYEDRMLLHQKYLEFVHPVTKEKMTFSIPLLKSFFV
ncbi:MAG: RNA pseudouridine synthase [Chlamydiota bacterium]